MQRVTLTLDDDLVTEIDQLMQRRGYQSRSEAVRDIVRAGFQHLGADATEGSDGGSCVAALVYVYERSVRELARRLSDVRAQHHHMMVATTSVDLDHDSCLEVALMRGATADVRHVGEHIAAERGVRHGRLVVVPVEVERTSHPHGHGRPHAHDHFKVRQGG
jgi:CopG family nickel-responsive transcriptional regulator